MGRLSMLPQVALVVKRNQQQIAESLHDPDISIRRRALDLLYGMCDAGNAQDIVRELLDYLIVSDFAIREELVLKIAILAEKYAPTQRWYLDVVLTMMDKAGDFVSDDIWHVSPLSRAVHRTATTNNARVRIRHRVVQIVTNSADLQAYAAEQVLVKLREGSAHESMLKISGAWPDARRLAYQHEADHRAPQATCLANLDTCCRPGPANTLDCFSNASLRAVCPPKHCCSQRMQRRVRCLLSAVFSGLG